MNKKSVLIALTVILMLVFTSVALAVTPLTDGAKHKQSDRFNKHKSCNLEQLIKDSLQKNKGDMAKVKEDLAKLYTEKSTRHETKLQEIAKQKGISVEELKAQFAEKHKDKLAAKAKEKNLSVEELQQKFAAKHKEKMTEMAKNLGISVEQLQEILPKHPGKM